MIIAIFDFIKKKKRRREKKKKKKRRSEYTYGLTFGQLASLNVGLVKNDYVAVFFGDYE